MIATSNDKKKASIISISEKAREKLILLMKEEGLDPGQDFVRCGVNSGGCSGLSYELAFEKKSEAQLDVEDDVYVYEGLLKEEHEGYFSDNSDEVKDEGYFSDEKNLNKKNNSSKNEERNKINLVINKQSKLYLAGSKLDYAGGLNGRGFYFNNPNAKRTCGCGESFSS